MVVLGKLDTACNQHQQYLRKENYCPRKALVCTAFLQWRTLALLLLTVLQVPHQNEKQSWVSRYSRTRVLLMQDPALGLGCLEVKVSSWSRVLASTWPMQQHFAKAPADVPLRRFDISVCRIVRNPKSGPSSEYLHTLMAPSHFSLVDQRRLVPVQRHDT